MTEQEKKEIINHRVEQSNRTILEADLLIKNKSLAAAVNRIYYSVFYIISALGMKDNFSSSKHTQLLGWFNKKYIATGKIKKEYGRFIHNLFNKRMEGDYEVFVEFLKADVIDLYNQARILIAEIKKLIN
ncbi:MAG: HEPN domain-containing protein [Bacteroidota bacterium]